MKCQKTIAAQLGQSQIFLYSLSNDNGLTVTLSNYGGIVTSVMVPDKDGKKSDIVLGFDNIQSYLSQHPYFGSIVGRYANRIAGSTFHLFGKKNILKRNDGPNHLHGGLKGFDKVLWQAKKVNRPDHIGVLLTYESYDGEEGYPGKLDVEVYYALTKQNELIITYKAKTDKPTIVNLSHHSYFNLTGIAHSNIYDHRLTIFADTFLPVEENLIPLSESKNVSGTPMDFTKECRIGDRLNVNDDQITIAGGFDHTWILNGWDGNLRLAAILTEPQSGRRMEVRTTEPGIQLYTGNHLDGLIKGKNNVYYNKYAGLCLETQHYPDTPNRPEFPSTVLLPGEQYFSSTVYAFSVI